MKHWFNGNNSFALKGVDNPGAAAARIEQHAEFCYTLCSQLFGPPKDPNVQSVLFPSAQDYVGPAPPWAYFLQYSAQGTETQACMGIATVTFDRVTYRCRSRLLKTWFDTALRYTFAYYAMERAGWRYSAIQNRWEILSLLREPVSISNVANVPSRRRYLHCLIAPVRYPDHYVEAAIALGAALLAIVDWESLAGLLQHDSIEAWMATLPGTARDCVNEVLWPREGQVDELASAVSPEYFIRLATAFSFVKRDTAATQFFELAIQSVPESFENRLLLLKHLLRTEQIHLSSRFAEECERLLPVNLDLQAILGEIALQKGDTANALERLIRAASLESADPTNLLKLGEALDKSGRIQDALSAFARAETTDDLFIASAARSWMEALEPGILKTRTASGPGSGIQLA